MFKSFKPLAGLSLLLLAGVASATTIGFGGLSKKSFADTYTENGYELSSSTSNMIALGSPKFLDTTGFSFASTTGAAFDLDAFDLAFNSADNVTLSYTFADGSSGTLALNDKNNDHYKFDLDDLTSFSLAGTATTGRGKNRKTVDADFFVDSIKVSDVVPASAVPEPTSMALLLAGIGMIGLMARRRRA